MNTLPALATDRLPALGCQISPSCGASNVRPVPVKYHDPPCPRSLLGMLISTYPARALAPA